jgi:hypothetical protein
MDCITQENRVEKFVWKLLKLGVSIPVIESAAEGIDDGGVAADSHILRYAREKALDILGSP